MNTTTNESIHTINFNDALVAAADRAQAKYPADTARILRGLSLVEADAVTDCTRLRAGAYTVRSAREGGQHYNVWGGGTACSCPDWEQHGHEDGFYCKHGWAVLLVRAARRDMASPRLRHAYHLVSGEEGHARYLADGRAYFAPGG